jgi:hypothetical protein
MLRLTAAQLTITVSEPVFTIVRQQDETIIRVAEGTVSVKSSVGGRPVAVSAGQQLTVADGQRPGAPTTFSTSQISEFELDALEQLLKSTAPPAVTGVSPASGPTEGGTSVVITGTGFAVLSHVYFGGTPAESFTVDSATQITAISPPGNGTVDITVSTPAGASAAGRFTYTDTPAVTRVSPPSGPTAGGTKVVITGTGFAAASHVYFGGTEANFTVDSATQITAISPPGKGIVHITVTTLAGTSTPTTADLFMYQTPVPA